MDDMIRFNEAIDQVLAESISSYAAAVQASRDVFLVVLGHDLRTPLNAIPMGADVLLRIVGDLLDFTRSHLGRGIPVNRVSIDIAPVFERIVDESRAVYPDANIVVMKTEYAEGEFDSARLEQVFSNGKWTLRQSGPGLVYR
ncbi:sensor histidine kinase [Pseudomonas mucidolens]|nr:sensor histidine kinase [Pseudomonas mucidolens]